MGIIILVAVIVVVGLLASALVTIVNTHRTAFSVPDDSVKAFYLAEAGLEAGKKFVSVMWDEDTEPSWAGSTDGYYFLYTNEPLEDGTFDLGVHWGTGTEAGYASFVSYGHAD
jgi:Tfp pilus assembly protein PilX